MKNQHDLAEAWFKKGDSDLTATEVTLKSEGPYDTACFHAQQAVEKYLKGFIELHKEVALRTHDLAKLNERCKVHGASWNIGEKVLTELTDYTVESRYQLDFYPDKETASKALSNARLVCKTVLEAQQIIKKGGK